MRKFITKLGLVLFPVILVLAFLIFTINGYTDTYYYKFLSKNQNSLIIGSSRAHQGLIPSIIDSITERNGMLNFAFNIENAPYGEVYLKAIKKKVRKNTQNGIFILAIDPWTISSRSNTPEKISSFRENSGILNKINYFSMNPNLEYIYKYIKVKTMLHGLLKKYNIVNHKIYLHSDGWLEISVPMDSNIVDRRIRYKIKAYIKNLSEYQFSNKRLKFLEETISFLQKYGKVYLVRLPVHKRILEIENDLIPNFDTLAKKIKLKYDVPYINFTKDTTHYIFTDGNHLYKESSKNISEKLAKIIMKP